MKPQLLTIEEQNEAINDISCLLVLGGNMARASRTIDLLDKKSSRDNIHVFFLGETSGINYKKPDQTEAEQMWFYARRHQDKISAPGDYSIDAINGGRDTISDYAFSWPSVVRAMSRSPNQNVGIVTDGFHAKRALSQAEFTFPEEYQFTAFTCSDGSDGYRAFQEWAAHKAQMTDLKRLGVEAHDTDAVRAYVEEKHPMYVDWRKEDPMSLYGMGITLAELGLSK